MCRLSLRLPESLHRKVRELAERDEISINQFIATAVAEKTATLLTVAYLEERAQHGSTRLFDRVLARVRDVPPVAGDELPQRRPKGTKGTFRKRRKGPPPEPVHPARS